MPNPNNVSKQIESTSPNTESVNATLVKNTVENQINGVPPSSQNYTPSSLNSSDYSSIAQAQQQSNYYVSQTDKVQYKTNPATTSGSNPNPTKEYDVGIPYNYASDKAAESKYQRVTTDYKTKESTSLPTKWGDAAVSDNIETIGRQNISNKSVLTLYRDVSNWGLQGSSLKDRDDYNSDWCVTIEEDREGIDRISSEGEFGTDRVCVRVYQRVTTFNFGTSQQFQTISPRGSQTPLRFYENNPGRTLSFSAEFHQQEFPLQPLMSIAEKLQYLARTYKHGDYSLIPKLVKITIPGRTFRGYLTDVGITYQGEDYTSWNKEEIKAALNSSVVNSWSNTYRSFSQMAIDQGFLPDKGLQWENHYSGKYGFTYDGNLNSGDAVNYGMEKMTASLTLAIVEEIKLTQYTTFREHQTQYIMDNQERAAEIQQEVIASWSDEYKRVGELLPTLVDAGGNPLTDENGKPYNSYDINELIYVDRATGEVQALHAWEGTPDQNMITLKEYMELQEVKNTNSMSPDSSVYSSAGVVEASTEVQSTDEAIEQIIKYQSTYGSINGVYYTEEELQKLAKENPEQLSALRIQSCSNGTAKNRELVTVTSFFAIASYNRENETYKVGSYLNDQNIVLFKDLLSLQINNIDDCKNLTKFNKTMHFENEYKVFDKDGSLTYLASYPLSVSNGARMGALSRLDPKYGLSSVSQQSDHYSVLNLMSSDYLAQKYKDWLQANNKETKIDIPKGFSNPESLKKNYTFKDPETGKDDTGIIDCIVQTAQAIVNIIPTAFLYFIEKYKEAYPDIGVYPTAEAGVKNYSKDGYDSYTYIESAS